MDAREAARERVERALPDLLALSHRIHAHPELAFEEERAATWVGDALAAAGFTVSRGIAGLPTALAARAGSGPLHLAFLAEYDCLPGMGHACGHNLIAAMVGGIEIEPNTAIMVAPWVIHRHRKLWDAPDYFMPERFAPGAREKINRFAYIPFGGGPRICIGMAFAMQEAVVILSTIAQRYRLELLPGQKVEPLARITLRPRYGLKMKIVKR